MTDRIICPCTYDEVDSDWCETYLSGVPVNDLEKVNKVPGCKHMKTCKAYKLAKQNEAT